MSAPAPAPARRSWALWLPLVIFGVFVLLFVWGLSRQKDDTVPSRLVGQPLPAFDLPAALAGKPALYRADLMDGRPRLLNVFASWCIPCAAEAPQLARLKASGVEIDGVAIRDHRDALAQFLATNGDPYTRLGADDLGKLQIAIGSSGVPETYVIDGRGVIRYQHIGDISEDDVALLLGRLREAAQ